MTDFSTSNFETTAGNLLTCSHDLTGPVSIGSIRDALDGIERAMSMGQFDTGGEQAAYWLVDLALYILEDEPEFDDDKRFAARQVIKKVQHIVEGEE